MHRAMLAPDLIEVPRAVDTPTVCNALELAAGGYRTTTAAPKPMKPMLGDARYRPHPGEETRGASTDLGTHMQLDTAIILQPPRPCRRSS